MTTAANDFKSKIHDRMLVIIRPEKWEDWLNSEIQQTEGLQSFSLSHFQLAKSQPGIGQFANKWLAP
jgi:putative SOS response-associated peptidase YedK